jgi:serine/threonine-protein kinase
MQLHLDSNNYPTPEDRVISCWRVGRQITGGRWYNIFRVAPRSVAADAPHDFVLKVVNPHLDAEDTARALDRLSRESIATEQILHPNVIRLLDAELDQPEFFLVQPWIEGRSLDRLFSRVPYLPLTRMLWVLRQVTEGVRAGHEKCRAYLGLDPTHILLGRTGRATLIGWSQSYVFGEKAWLPHDRIQAARYTAPECFEDDYQAIPESDVYSLGVLIHHAFALTPPIDGPDIPAIKLAHAESIPEDLIIAQPNCPPALAALVKQMLSKDPFMRPSSREVLDELIAIEIEHLSNTTLIKL